MLHHVTYYNHDNTGAENTEDRTYTCGIKLPDEEDEWTLTLSVDVIG